jgi:UDP-N-acetylmuramoyl-L-alanyl-D-glutamate--2,6-diaminopimelate ligase
MGMIKRQMSFDELIKLTSLANGPRVCVDSRLVNPGDVFVAVPGTVRDGHNFINQAIANGARYIVCENRKSSHQLPVTSYEIVVVNDSARAAALLAQASRGNPASKLTNLAVTGTNGKTTVAFLVRSCIQKAGAKCGLVGTVLYDTCSGQTCESTLTTPDYLSIADITEQVVKNGAKYMVIEASSHALSQNRLAGISFKAAAFTNLTGDHLDYHKTKEEYLAAKTKLFLSLSPDATAVLNKQSPEAKLIAKKIWRKPKILWYAIDEPTAPAASCEARAGADITAHIESMDMDGTVFTLEYTGRSSSLVSRPSSIVKSPLLGRHNVSNSLAAAGLCIAAGFDLETIAAGLSASETIPGRLEKIDWEGNFSVIVDYAHTDDALKNVLSTLKPLCKGKLRVVFGCGGDRDRTKRPRMAKVAEQLADFVIVTSDNPRTERPEAIIKEIIAGFENPNSLKVTVEQNRRRAIELAINSAEKGDIVLIAGKGHETYQIIGTQKFDFSDKKIAQECLKELIR